MALLIQKSGNYWTYFIYNVGSETNDITREYFGHFGLLAGFTQPDVVDKGPIATSGVEDEEPVVLVNDHGMLPREDFAIKKAISGISLKKRKIRENDVFFL